MDAILDLWLAVDRDPSSTQSSNLVDVLRRLSMFAIADIVEHELNQSYIHRRCPNLTA